MKASLPSFISGDSSIYRLHNGLLRAINGAMSLLKRKFAIRFMETAAPIRGTCRRSGAIFVSFQNGNRRIHDTGLEFVGHLYVSRVERHLRVIHRIIHEFLVKSDIFGARCFSWNGVSRIFKRKVSTFTFSSFLLNI